MAPKKAEPLQGQRSIQAFFSSKPKKDTPAQAPYTAPAVAEKPAPAPAAAAPKPQPAPVPKAAETAPEPEAPPTEGGTALVGRGVRVFWSGDDAWYEGRLSSFDASTGKHLVEYEDGEEEWVDLGAEKVELLGVKPPQAKRKRSSSGGGGGMADLEDSDSEGEAPKRKGKGGAAARKTVVDSESEYDASEGAESSGDEEESLVDEEESEEEDDVAVNGAAKNKGSGSGKKRPAVTPAMAKKKRCGGGAGPAPAARTPGVALNQRISITPPSAVVSAAPPAKPTASHAPASAAALRSALDRKPAAGGGGSSPSTALAEGAAADANDASRFMARETARFPFLHPDKIRDAAKRRPNDPGFDPCTVHVPPEWFKQAKVSEGQRQWWEFKAANFRSVILFKMGKFYELFEMDAHVGAEVLGLSYMKGDQPHAGFPEAAYAQMAERLARAGHRVVVVEQTETPDMLAVRNEARKKVGLKKDNVVRREKVAVLTRGTLTDADMMGAVTEAQYVMAVAEAPIEGDSGGGDAGGRDAVWVGAAAVDVATGQLLVGQWYDDDLRGRLRGALTVLSPVEIVIPRAGGGSAGETGGSALSGASRRVVKGVLAAPTYNELPAGPGNGQFWGAEETWRRLLAPPSPDDSEDGAASAAPSRFRYFPKGELPAVLRAMAEDRAGHAAAVAALGGCVSYLQEALLDRRVLGAGQMVALEEAVGVGGSRSPLGSKTSVEGGVGAGVGVTPPPFMALDGPALENLEIMENSEGGVAGTLLAALDHCTTPFGRRRLRQWLCRPLCRVADIVARQDAVADLLGPAEEAAGAARRALAGVADLERALARLGAAGAGLGSARDSPKVVLYEDVSKKRVAAFASALRALERVQEAAQAFAGCGATAALLLDLVTAGRGKFPAMAGPLGEMQGAADWEEAERSGKVVPGAGVDAEYDAAEAAVEAAEAALQEYLKEVKAELGCREVRYASLNKESHVIEVPEAVTVPRTWESMQGKKGVKRYVNAELRALVTTHEAALDGKERAQSGILRSIMRRFAEHAAVWTAAVDATATLDALMSLAVAAASGAAPMTRPVIRPWAADAPPVLRAVGLRHPAGVAGSGGAFVPNDVILGGDSAPPFVVLTGPNMGGKSTLMRQVCLAAVAAQVGAWVPAEALELTPVDAAFVRMGARDRIMLGQSTFFVELSETAAALASATRHSLVALDELGRGTATTDGAAIAAAVLDHLARSVRCRGVFATHYHHISDSHAHDPAVAIKHMACAVTAAEDAGGVDHVTFLYRLTDGACPKSYGVNVARLAGLPEPVVRRAALVSERAAERGVAGLRELPLGVDAGAAMEVDEGEGEEALEGVRRRVVAAARSGDATAVKAAVAEVRQVLEALAV